MRIPRIRLAVVAGLLLLHPGNRTLAQAPQQIRMAEQPALMIEKLIDGKGRILDCKSPLFSFRLGEELITSKQFNVKTDGDSILATGPHGIDVVFRQDGGDVKTWKGTLTLLNRSKDTLEIWNVVPFGEAPDRVYITGLGRHHLSRTHLFRPGLQPVNVIVPDNAWNLGFSEVKGSDYQLCALSRRGHSSHAQIRRFENILYPGGSVTYNLFAEFYSGVWQEGIRRMFQERYLYDLDFFDNALYDREDLQWVRHSYVSHLIYGWDHAFFESEELRSTLEDFIVRGKSWYGGDDFIGIWPTWPSLGLDQRNQWDLFRDMPGGLSGLREIADMCRRHGVRFFICYNPWDEDTRSEGHTTGMADLIKEIGADGVVLDTRGSSSWELQMAADSVRSGVVMYSEGMAVPRDMPGIVSGRVHNALYYPPLLNLNKMIKPDFSIFRVAELAFEPIRREYATSFFNGYGTELNIFKPGRPDWIREDYRFFGETVRILRENSSNFVRYDFIPLIPTLHDQLHVNQWPGKDKTVYTILSLVPQGFDGPLFEAGTPKGYHWVDLWEHRELEPVLVEGKSYIPVRTESFHERWKGTNNEGAVSAVALFPHLLTIQHEVDQLTFSAPDGDQIRIWPGDPDYSKEPALFSTREQTISLRDHFGRLEGDFVIQLFKGMEILDERIIYLKPGTARLISTSVATEPAQKTPKGMLEIPSGSFTMKTTNGDEFIEYPPQTVSAPIIMKGFYMDRYPVTNGDFYQFIRSTGYQPTDKVNYLKHWEGSKPPRNIVDHPVIYISWEEAKAYAGWAGKRLPTEVEWQYAAQTEDLLPWPWGGEEGVSRELQWVTNTLTVSKIKGIDSVLCNLGNGIPEPVGAHPKGVNPFGLEDLVGSVWQLTNDLYDNGTVHYVIMKGGSYFNPGSSWWYVQGGPRELHYRQMLLRLSRGYERNATVGFRCVRDR